MTDRSDGSTASYYQLPPGCTELQDLISYRNMNSQDGEIFRAIYRKGRASHSDELRDAKKVLFYAQAEVNRLEALESQAAPELLANLLPAIAAQDVSVPVLNKTREQWQKLDANFCAEHNSKAANFYLIRDAQQDIERLHRALLNGGLRL